MASKAQYFIDTAEWVAGHGDALVRQGCDELEGQYLVFVRKAGTDVWRRTNHGTFAGLDEAVVAATEIPSVAEQGRRFAEAVKDIMGGQASPDMVATLDRLIDYDEAHPEELS